MADDIEWSEVTEDLWREPGEIRRKLRLLADANLPQPFIDELRGANIDVRTAKELGASNLDDRELFAYAKRMRMVLLTMDIDFWSDRKFPPEEGGGIIVVASSPEDVQTGLRAFGLLFGCFAKSFGGDWSRGLRAKAFPDRFILRMVSYEGKRVAYEMKLSRGYLWAREIHPADPL